MAKIAQDMLPSFELTKNVGYGEQIREKMRGLLSSGKLPTGEKLPSVRKFAALLGTNRGTVHVALKALEKEGLLSSSPRRGMFVQKHEKKLTCVGVYCTTNVKGSPYAHAVREAIATELHNAGIEIDLWMDPRPADQFGEPWTPLVKAAESRRFQAFIATEVDLSVLQWQRKLPVSTAFVGELRSVPNSVNHDMRQFVEISLLELARQGCRSVGCIAPFLNHAEVSPDSQGHQSMIFDMLKHFTDIAADHGLIVKNDWMRMSSDHHLGVQEQEYFGYEQFLKLWSQPEKPEGLLVFSDVVARGVIMAIQKEQVRVPNELKLALSKNESIDLFCPMPATFVVASEREMARALIEQVQKQFRGESCERISLPFHLAPHNNL